MSGTVTKRETGSTSMVPSVSVSFADAGTITVVLDGVAFVSLLATGGLFATFTVMVAMFDSPPLLSSMV